MNPMARHLKLKLTTLVLLSTLLPVAFQTASAQTETVLYSFLGGSDGSDPNSSLVADSAGNLYGATYSGGLGSGTVFELSPSGGAYTETLLYSFCALSDCADGAGPTSTSLIFDSAGNLYGMTTSGGANGYGVVFELSPGDGGWTETVLYSLAGNTVGPFPGYNLLFDSAGNLYGIVGYYSYGGGGGIVFELSPSSEGWTEQTIYMFGDYSGNNLGLAMNSAGDLFGDTTNTVFELTPDGSGSWTATTIHTFTGGTKDGDSPEGNLVFDSAGNLYGTAWYDGAKGNGVVWKLSPVTTGKKKGTWSEKILYSFPGGKSPGHSYSGLVLDSAGNVYGTTYYGGKYGDGTVFELVAPVTGTAYKEKTLWNFDGSDGSYSYSSLILDSAGNLYGTASSGGADGEGVVFKVTP